MNTSSQYRSWAIVVSCCLGLASIAGCAAPVDEPPPTTDPESQKPGKDEPSVPSVDLGGANVAPEGTVCTRRMKTCLAQSNPRHPACDYWLFNC